jgi:ABC-type polysaccharide/polyol phosphate transport system ATPase subunit
MTVRLAFGAMINVDPEILLVDEALAVGDVRFQQKCVKKIEQLQARGKTIIFVSHDVAAVKRFCQQAVLLDGGRVLCKGAVEEIVPAYEELMETGVIAPKHFTAPGVMPVPTAV